MSRTTLLTRLLITGAAVALLAGCSASGDPTTSDEGIAGPESATDDDNQSTFAIDIDTASYDYAARLLNEGTRPSPGQIRPEEFVNAFDQDYPEPVGEGITVSADGTRPPAWYGSEPTSRIMRVGLQTRPDAEGERPPAALTFVIDVSGSMGEPGRLDLVQKALHHLIDQLGPDDSVAIVAYSDTAKVLHEMAHITDRASLHGAVDDLAIANSTNLEAGLVKGYDVARAGFISGSTNRVILLSDGLANNGSTSAESILARVREQAGTGIALLCVGVGSEYGDALMEKLADNGDGFAVYVSEEQQAKELFVTRLPSTLTVRARDAKVQVTFDPKNVTSYHLIGFEDREIADDDFRDDNVDGGEVGAGHSVTALYEITLSNDASGSVATANVRWLSPSDGVSQEAVTTVDVRDLDRDWRSATPRMRVDLIAGAFARVLRGDLSTSMLGMLQEEADSLAKVTEDAKVVRLAGLIRRAAEVY